MSKMILAILTVVLALATTIPAWALQATLTWTNPASSTATGVRIERGTGPDPVTFTSQGTVGPTVTTFNQTGLTTGTRFCYRVVEFNGFGDAAPSAQACGTPDVPLPASGLTIIFSP